MQKGILLPVCKVRYIMNIVKRDIYLERLIQKRQNGLIKVITGIRRCGKSFLLFRLFYDYLIKQGVKKDNIIAVPLDDFNYFKYTDPEALYAYLKEKTSSKNEMYYILLDEVQYAINKDEVKSNRPLKLYAVLNGLLGQGNTDIYVTGSNSRFLSTDIMTEFRGRGDIIRVYPFNFKEFTDAYPDMDKYQAYREYSLYGGMPGLLTQIGDANKIAYLHNLLNETYLKDIVERNNLRNDVLLGQLVDVLASSVGALTNPKKLQKTFGSKNIKTTDVTISCYIDFLREAFIVDKVLRYNIKRKNYIDTPYKIYFSDIGLRNCRLNFRQQEPTHIMENIIYNELIVRGYNVDVGTIEFSKRNAEGKLEKRSVEVDFVCNSGYKRYYIQSAFGISTNEKMEQECSSFNKIDDSFAKIIITNDLTKPYRNNKGYLIINIFDFLLNDKSLDL